MDILDELRHNAFWLLGLGVAGGFICIICSAAGAPIPGAANLDEAFTTVGRTAATVLYTIFLPAIGFILAIFLWEALKWLANP